MKPIRNTHIATCVYFLWIPYPQFEKNIENKLKHDFLYFRTSDFYICIINEQNNYVTITFPFSHKGKSAPAFSLTPPPLLEAASRWWLYSSCKIFSFRLSAIFYTKLHLASSIFSICLFVHLQIIEKKHLTPKHHDFRL